MKSTMLFSLILRSCFGDSKVISLESNNEVDARGTPVIVPAE